MVHTYKYKATVNEYVPTLACQHVLCNQHQNSNSSASHTTSRSWINSSSSTGSDRCDLEKRLANLTVKQKSEASSSNLDDSSTLYCINMSRQSGTMSDSRASSSCSSSTSCSNCTSTVCNDYIYTDSEEGISLLERHYPPPSSSSYSSSLVDSTVSSLYNLKSKLFTSGDKSTSVDSASFRSASLPPGWSSMSSTEIREELGKRGDVIGPITPSTRKVYLLRILAWQKGHIEKPINIHASQYEFSPELHKVMGKGLAWLLESEVKAWDVRLAADFDASRPVTATREGTGKRSFNYLLLDPRITRNLPAQSDFLSEDELFTLFIYSIFYVGKGKLERPYAHFYDAVKYRENERKKVVLKPNDKLSRISDIWSCDLGVVCLRVNQSITSTEAYTRESLMIDALSIGRLTNIQKGRCYGEFIGSLDIRMRQRLGSYFLYKSMKVLLADGERQIKPVDL